MEKLFKLKVKETDVRTEVIGGLTTFMTLSYIIALNPNILTNFGVGSPLWNAVFCATLIATAAGTFCMAFIANKPFVMSFGMGLNSFFSTVVTQIVAITGVSYTNGFQAWLSVILIEGILFLSSRYLISGKRLSKPARSMTGIGWRPMIISVISVFLGLVLKVAFDHKEFKGAVLFGKIIAYVFNWVCQFVFLGTNPFASLHLSLSA